MRTVNEEARQAKKIEIMEKAYDCYAEHGLNGVGVKAVAEACGCNVATLYQYFENLDDLIIQSTAYCMTKVEDDFMALAPTDPEDAIRFIEQIPYWTAKKHGKKYPNISNTERSSSRASTNTTQSTPNSWSPRSAFPIRS